MNAAGERLMTPLLGILCAIGATALLAFMAGVGRQESWDAPAETGGIPASVKPAVGMPPTTPLAAQAEIWQRPLFSADRKPVQNTSSGAAGGNLGDLELTGIIMTPTLRMALLTDRTKAAEVRVREGATLPGGQWKLASLGPRGATFGDGGEHRQLGLKTAAPEKAKTEPAGANALPAPASVPTMASAPPMQISVPSAPPRDVSQARTEALKAAVQKRRASQAARPANEGVR
jgi:general secretion pathway protein N